MLCLIPIHRATIRSRGLSYGSVFLYVRLSNISHCSV